MTLIAFLRRELAPAPGRFRAAARILVGCLAALVCSLVIGGNIAPHGHWVIITVFTLSLADVGASLRKAVQRAAGTLAGGLAGMLLVAALADFPVVFVPALGAVVAVGVFLSLTANSPYVFLLSSVTFVLVAFFPAEAPETAIATGLWRMFAITIGVLCGTGAQLVLWPEDPEERLRRVLARRLTAVADAARQLAALARGERAQDVAPPALAGDDLTAQLDLLTNAEARHPSLRQRHTEQLAIIVEVDRLLTTTAWLADSAREWNPAPDGVLERELCAVGDECRALAAALAAGRPPAEPPPPALASPLGGLARPGLRAVLDDVRLALGRTRGGLAFLDPSRVVAPALDRPARVPILTDAVSLKNAPAVGLALKVALSLEICYVLMHALHWQDMLIAAVTVVITAQSSLGASVQKSILRVSGALLGGLLGLAVIVVAMPNIESLGSLLVVASLGFGVAAWIMAGSARIAYVGLQAGMAFAMCVTDATGPTIDLATGRDRVIGVLVGVLILLAVSAALWPARARLAMRPTLARTLRSIAGLARVAPDTREYRAQLARAVKYRSSIYSGLGAALRLSAESTLEPDAQTPAAQADRVWIGRLAADAQAVFLALLALIRHRLAPAFPGLPPEARAAMTELDHEVAAALDALADRVEGGALRPLPDLAARFAALEGLASRPSEPGREHGAVSTAELDHVAIAREVLDQVARLRDAIERGPADAVIHTR